MKKKILLVCLIIFVGLAIFFIMLLVNKDTYVVKINNKDSITRIVYQSSSGNVYEVIDKDAINEFVESINDKKFIEKESYKDKMWSDSYVELYNEKNECILSIELLGEKSIILDRIVYEAEEAFSRSVLENSGVLVGNAHEDN